MRYKTMLLAILLISLAGCSPFRDPLHERAKTLPYQYSHFDALLSWEYRHDNGSTVVDGVVRNNRYAIMDDMEIWVHVIDGSGRVVDRSVGFVHRLAKDQSDSFSVRLPATAPGTRLMFIYKYVGFDGGGVDEDAIRWSQSFSAEIPR